MASWFKVLLALLLEGRAHGELSIAVHAQSRSEIHGWVAGSEITTRGVCAAMISIEQVTACEIFAPFYYGRLGSRVWDILLIEGYSGPVEHVIRTVRRINRKAMIAHWLLDTYPSLSTVAALPVDLFFTNSRLVAARGFRAAADRLDFLHSGEKHERNAWLAIADEKPRRYVALGVDGSFCSQEEHESIDPFLIVYLGQASVTKRMLVSSLVAISQVPGAKLEIYGSAWDRFADPRESNDATLYSQLVKCCWKGRLDSKAIPTLYRRAAIILGTTEHEQRQLGMVNNRVFEALASSVAGTFIAFEEALDSEFVELRRLLDSNDGKLTYSPIEAARAVAHTLATGPSPSNRSDFCLRHSYARRVDTMLSTILNMKHDLFDFRRGSESIVLVYDDDLTDWTFFHGLLPAIMQLEPKYQYRFRLTRMVRSSTLHIDHKDTSWCAGARIVLARGAWNGTARKAVADLDEHSACARGSGIAGVPRPPIKMLLLARGQHGAFLSCEKDTEKSLEFDSILYDGFRKETSCLAQHPRVEPALGLYVEGLRDLGEGWHSSFEAERSGPFFLGAGRKHQSWWRLDDSIHASSAAIIRTETLGHTLRRAEILEHTAAPDTGGEFELLAGLVAGGVVRVSADNSYLTDLLAATTTGELPIANFSLPQLTEKLFFAIEAALDPPRAAAQVQVIQPQAGERIHCQRNDKQPMLLSCSAHIVVALRAFVPPDDGVWCVRINGTELSCQGDTKSELDVSFQFKSNDSAGRILALCAVLRSGDLAGHLDQLPIVRTSQEVMVEYSVLL